MLRSNQRHAEHQIHYSKQKVGEQVTEQLSRLQQVSLTQTDGEEG